MNKFKIYFVAVSLFFLTTNSFSFPGDCGICDDCGVSPTNYCGVTYNGDLAVCYGTESTCGGIPINDNKVLLVIGGVILALGYKSREKFLAYQKSKKLVG